jgi:hypothetical protein
MGYLQMTRNVESIFGAVVTAPHQIPYTYTATGGETFISLPFYPVTGFITINGGVQVPVDNYEIDGNTVNLGRALEADDVVYCLFDKILSPEDYENGIRIYKFQAVGNETSFTPDFTSYGVQSLYVDGRFQVPGVNYSYNSTTGVVSFLTGSPAAGVWVVAEMSIKQNYLALSSDGGASLIGTSSGQTVQEELNDIDTDLVKLKLNWAIENGYTDAGFTFYTGGTLGVNDRNKVVYDPVSKTWYSWAGTLPHVIAAGANPVGTADWIPQTDPNLRDDLVDTTNVVLGDALIGMKQPLASAVSRTVHDKLLETISIRDFGAIGDGVTNDTAALQSAILSGARKIDYPAGTYLVDSGVLMLESNQIHSGNNAIIKVTLDKEGQAVFTGIEKSNIVFKGLRFDAASSVSLAPAVNLVSCNNVSMRNCVSVIMALFSTKSRKCPNPMIAHDIGFGAGSAYPLITTDADYCTNIEVVNCQSYGSGDGVLGAPFRPAAIYTAYAKMARISGNYIDGHKEGIQFVGGDALKADEGYDMTKPRKCNDVTISGNTVRNAVGGIWGAMGDRVTITGNAVDGCKDVCIDFESCTDSVAVGNNTKDALNGCLVAIGLCKGVIFDGNTAVLNNPSEYTSIGGIYYEQDQDVLTSVSFVNNKFTSFNKQAILHIKSCATVKIDNNQFENIQVTTTTNTTTTQGLRWFSFNGNQMLFTAPTPGAYTALTVGNIRSVGNVNISNNQIVHASVSPGQYGIRLDNTNSDSRAIATVSANIVYGYSEDINISYGNTSLVNLTGNIFQTRGGSGLTKVVATGNCDTNGNLWSW